jgi:hypothetical protein
VNEFNPIVDLIASNGAQSAIPKSKRVFFLNLLLVDGF